MGKQSTDNSAIECAIKLMRGEAGATVDLTVAREGLSEPKTYTVIR